MDRTMVDRRRIMEGWRVVVGVGGLIDEGGRGRAEGEVGGGADGADGGLDGLESP